MAKTPTKITARIDYWESKGLPKMTSTKTKVYKETVDKLTQLVNGTGIFGGTDYTMPDFRLSIDRHTKQVFDEHFFPTKKTSIKRMNLSVYLYSPFAQGKYQSALVRNIKYPPTPVTIQRNNTDLFQALAKLYIKEYNNGIKVIDDLTSIDQLNLANAANMISKYYKTRKKKMDNHVAGGNIKVASLLIKAAKSFTKNNPEKFCTGLLSRPWVWEKFPNYLQKNGFLVPQKTFNINQC